MASIDARLTALEHAIAGIEWRLFGTVDGIAYFEIDGSFTCLDAFEAAEQGNPDKRRAWSGPEIDAVAETAQCLIVTWTDDWRGDEH